MRIGEISAAAVHPGYYEITHPVTSSRANQAAKEEVRQNLADSVLAGTYGEDGRLRPPYHPVTNPDALNHHYSDDPTSLLRGIRKFSPVFDPIKNGVFDVLADRPLVPNYQEMMDRADEVLKKYGGKIDENSIAQLGYNV